MTLGPIEIVTAVSAVIGGVLAVMQLRDRYASHGASIEHPIDGTEVSGRDLAVSGRVPKRRRGVTYWVAIQPCDTSVGQNMWWPQRHELTIEPSGYWSLENATLGRGGAIGEEYDVGKLFTIGLFEVTGEARERFSRICRTGERLKLSSQCRRLHAIKVRRIKDLSDRRLAAEAAERRTIMNR